jgi:hypothetical protein
LELHPLFSKPFDKLVFEIQISTHVRDETLTLIWVSPENPKPVTLNLITLKFCNPTMNRIVALVFAQLILQGC